LFSPDREPHPAVSEVKYLQQPIKIHNILSPRYQTLDVPSSGDVTISIKNRYVFQSLDNLKWTWSVNSDMADEIIKFSSFELNETSLQNSISLSIFDESSILKFRQDKANLWLNVKAMLKNDTSWAPKDHLIAREQFYLKFEDEKIGSNLSKNYKMDYLSVCDNLVVENLETTTEIWMINREEKSKIVVVDKTTGILLSYFSPDGRPIINADKRGEGEFSGLCSNFTRASTDNDIGGDKNSYHSSWDKVGLRPLDPPKQVCKSFSVNDSGKGGDVQIVADCELMTSDGKVLFKQRISYSCSKNGVLKLNVKVSSCDSLNTLSSIARIGMQMVLERSLYHIKYLGRGPHENYPDRKAAAEMGIWSTTPSQQTYQYIFPSENGNRSDCKWISFVDKSGCGVCIVDSDDKVGTGLNFSALLHSQKELYAAKHTTDCPERKDGGSAIFVNLDHKIMGVGGDLSWEPCVYPQYRIFPDGNWNYCFSLVPISPDINLEKVAKSFLFESNLSY